jgi:phage-related protein
MGDGLWEVRSDLAGNRTARILFCHAEGKLVALHAFIKKSRATPAVDLHLARQRMAEL